MYYRWVILSWVLYRLYTSQTAEHGCPNSKVALEWEDPKQKQNDTAILCLTQAWGQICLHSTPFYAPLIYIFTVTKDQMSMCNAEGVARKGEPTENYHLTLKLCYLFSTYAPVQHFLSWYWFRHINSGYLLILSTNPIPVLLASLCKTNWNHFLCKATIALKSWWPTNEINEWNSVTDETLNFDIDKETVMWIDHIMSDTRSA